MAIGQRTGLPARVIVDIEDYRKRQIDRLTARVREIAARVATTGRSETLEPMNPFLRKMVHTAVAEVDGVESSSEGEGAGAARRHPAGQITRPRRGGPPSRCRFT